MSKNFIFVFVAVVVTIGIVLLVKGPNSLTFVNQNPITSQTSSKEGKRIEGYSGRVLAGSTSVYIEFKKSDYDKALSSGKVVFLDFYANWCPICRAEEPEIHRGFDSLTENKIIGFRVNFNDSDTDNDEKQLAKDFNVPYQHTKIILKNGNEIFRSVDQWDKERFSKELKNF